MERAGLVRLRPRDRRRAARSWREQEELSDEAVALEEVYLGLRTDRGIPAERLSPEVIAAWTGGRLGANEPRTDGSGSRPKAGFDWMRWWRRRVLAARVAPGHLGAGLSAQRRQISEQAAM